MKPVFRIIILLSISARILSASVNPDSLLKLFYNAPTESEKLIQLTEYCNQFKYTYPDTCLKYINRYFEAKKHEITAENSKLMRFWGDVYWHLGDLEMAIKKYTLNYEFNKKVGNKQWMAQALGDIGYIEMEQGKYPEALLHYKQALVYSREAKDDEYIGVIGTYICQLYDWMGDYKEALKSYHEVRAHFSKRKGSRDYGVVLMNIGAVHGNRKRTDSALYYYDLALKEMPMSEEKSRAIIKINMAYNYMLEKRNLSQIRKMLEESMKVFEKYNSQSNITLTKYYFGVLHVEEGEYSKAVPLFYEALAQYQKEGNISRLSLLYDRLSFSYEKLGQKDSAFKMFKLYKQFNDSVLTDLAAKNMSQQRVLFDMDKKQLEIEALEQKQKSQKEQLQREKTQRYALFGGLLLLLVFGAFMYNRFKVTQKQKLIIEKQEKETQYQKHLIEEKQREIVDSINYAKRIQYALLAGDNLLKQNLPEHFVLFQPKDVVSGDFYWATPSPEGFIYITADCTGHGVPGAFMSLLNISKLSQAINENKIYRPDLILNNVRNEIIKALNPEGSTEESKDGMDAVLCKIEFKSMKLEYAAANNSFYVIRNGEILVCKADKMPVGKGHDDSALFTFNELQLQKGDVIYTFTDGYADQFGGPKGKKFKYKQLEEILVKIHHQPMMQQREVLLSAFNDWKGSLEQIDDVCVIGIRV